MNTWYHKSEKQLRQLHKLLLDHSHCSQTGVGMSTNPLKIYGEIDPEHLKLFKDEVGFVESDKALSAKVKCLIAMAIDAVLGKEGARPGTATWAQRAIKYGATKEEITEALRVAHHMGGAPTMFISADVLQKILGNKE